MGSSARGARWMVRMGEAGSEGGSRNHTKSQNAATKVDSEVHGPPTWVGGGS